MLTVAAVVVIVMAMVFVMTVKRDGGAVGDEIKVINQSCHHR